VTPREQRRAGLIPDPLGWACAWALVLGIGFGELLAGCGESSSHSGWVAAPTPAPTHEHDRWHGGPPNEEQAAREAIVDAMWASFQQTFAEELENSDRVHQRPRLVTRWHRSGGRLEGDLSVDGVYTIHVPATEAGVATWPHEVGHYAEDAAGEPYGGDPHEALDWWGQRGYRTDGRLSAWWVEQIDEHGLPDPWAGDREPK